MSWWRYLLLWLAGADLRLTVLAVPPVLPLIHRQLALDEASVAALTALPVLVMCLAAIPGSLVVSRIGARRAVIAGVLLTGMASALRGVGDSRAVLFSMTFLMSAGIAVMQPAMPSLVRAWAPRRIGLATTIYANGLLVGEAVAAAFTIPFILPLGGGTWQGSFAIWSIPVLLSAVALALYRSREVEKIAPVDGSGIDEDKRALWWPDWREPRTWQIGLIMSGASTIYFGANAFIPDYLTATGRSTLIGPSLSALNAAQLPASFLIAALARRWIGRREPIVAMALLAAGGTVAFLTLPPAGIIVGSAMIGFAAAAILISSLALPALLTDADDVHRLSAAMFTIGYGIAFVLPVIGGAAWDHTHVPAAAFIPLGLGIAFALVLGALLRIPATAASR